MSYNIVIGSQFKPFSYQEMALPAIQATQLHNELDTVYGTLNDEAAKWEILANSEPDKEVYQQYKNYVDSLKREADLLASEGLNHSSRRRVIDMKNRYIKEIFPIETAFNKRNELIKEQQQLKLKDNSLIFDNDARSMSLKNLMNNPVASYNYQSGLELTNRAAAIGAALKNEIQSGQNEREWRHILGDAYYETAMTSGISSTDILNYLKGAETTNPLAKQKLQAIYDTVANTSNTRKWYNSEKYELNIKPWIEAGLFSSVGTTTYKELQDPFTLAQIQAMYGKGRGTDLDTASVAVPTYDYDVEANDDYDRRLSQFKSKKYIAIDPNTKKLMVTDEGIEALKEEWGKFDDSNNGRYYIKDGKYYKIVPTEARDRFGSYSTESSPEEITKEEFYNARAKRKRSQGSFTDFLEEEMKHYHNTNGGTSPVSPNSIYLYQDLRDRKDVQEYFKNVFSRRTDQNINDLKQNPYYSINIDTSSAKDLRGHIVRTNDGTVKTYKRYKNSGQYEPTDVELTEEDIKDKDITKLRFDPHSGFFGVIQNTDGKEFLIKMNMERGREKKYKETFSSIIASRRIINTIRQSKDMTFEKIKDTLKTMPLYSIDSSVRDYVDNINDIDSANRALAQLIQSIDHKDSTLYNELLNSIPNVSLGNVKTNGGSETILRQ